MGRLWAGWRNAYVAGLAGDQPVDDAATDSGEDAEGRTLFEVLADEGRPDDETYILHRGPTCFAVMNAYPYSSGHLMVLPRRAVADLADLTADEHEELWATVRDAVAAVRTAFRPDGVNVGVNLGRAAGAGIPGHLHVHVVPRWAGDTNFTTTVANVRVLPEALVDSWVRVRDAWPT